MNSKSKLLFYIKGQVVPRPLTYTYITSCRKLTCCPSRKLLTGCSAQEQGYTNQRAKFVTQSARCLIQRAKLMQSVNWFVQNAKLLGQNGKFRTEDIMPPAQIVLQARFYSSSVFVSDRHSDSSSSFQFDHDLEEKLSDIEKLKTNLQRRGLHIDVEQLRRDYLEYVELHKEKFRLETEREDIARQIAVIVAQQKESKTKSKEQISQMKKLVEKGKSAKTRQKELMGKYWDVEEKVMISALSLPSNLSQDVPEKLVVLQEYFEDRKPAVPVDHDEVLRKSQMVRLSNVGHKAYYLTGRLAVLEQELVNHFSAHLRSKNITQMLAPEMFKTPVVEAGCIDVMDPASVYRLQYKQGTKQITDWNSDHMFLQGASQLSFLYATVPKTSTRCRQISHQSATPMQAIPWLENTVAKLWNAAHENGTKNLYNCAFKLFTFFMEQNALWLTNTSIPPAIDEQTLIYFVAFCTERGLKYHTIKQYLSGLRYHYLKNKVQSPLSNGSDLHQLQVILRGVKKSQVNIKQERLPITHEILTEFVSLLNCRYLGLYDSLMLAAACTMAFFGFLRCGEFTVHAQRPKRSNAPLTLQNIQFSNKNSSYVLFLPNSKADIFRSGVKLTITATNSSTCPVTHMDRYLNLRRQCGACATDPLFINSKGTTLTREFFIQSIHKLLLLLGKDTKLYSGHSFRIGAATTAARFQVPDHLIRTLGRWSSDCYTKYIRTDGALIQEAHKAMCGV